MSRQRAYRGLSAAVARTIGLLVAAGLIAEAVSGVSGLAHVLLDRRTVAVESYALLSSSGHQPAPATAGPGGHGTSAVVVLIRSVNGRGLLASHVVVTEAPRQAFGGNAQSVTVPTVYPSQTIAVILEGNRPKSPYHVRVAVGAWRPETEDTPGLPDVSWRRTSAGLVVRVTNAFAQATPAIRLVAAFFDRYGDVVAVGSVPVAVVPPGMTTTVVVPVAYGSAPTSARAALFEEQS